MWSATARSGWSRWNGWRVAAASQARGSGRARCAAPGRRGQVGGRGDLLDARLDIGRGLIGGAGHALVGGQVCAQLGLVGRWDDMSGHSSRAVLRVPAHGQTGTHPQPAGRHGRWVAGPTRGLQWTHGRPGARARLGAPAPGTRRPAPRTASVGARDADPPRLGEAWPRRSGAAGWSMRWIASWGPAEADEADEDRRHPAESRRATPALVADAAGLHRRGRGVCAVGARLAPGRGLSRPFRHEQPGDPMSDPIEPVEISTLDRTLLEELEPEVGRLVERHLKVAKEWFPHEYIPYSLGRDFDTEPWTPDQPRLTGVAQTAFEVNLLTEDNLPSYHRLIHGMFGQSDGPGAPGRPLDRRGGPARDRAARLPHGHPQRRPRRARARADGHLQQGFDRLARTRSTGWRTSPSRSSRPGSPIATPAATPTTRSPTGSWSGSPPTRTCTWSSTATSSRAALEVDPVRDGPRDRRRGHRVRDAGRRHPRLHPQGRPDRPGRHLRPARPPRRGPDAAAAALGHLRAGGPRRRRRGGPSPAGGRLDNWSSRRSGSKSAWHVRPPSRASPRRVSRGPGRPGG